MRFTTISQVKPQSSERIDARPRHNRPAAHPGVGKVQARVVRRRETARARGAMSDRAGGSRRLFVFARFHHVVGNFHQAFLSVGVQGVEQTEHRHLIAGVILGAADEGVERDVVQIG